MEQILLHSTPIDDLKELISEVVRAELKVIKTDNPSPPPEYLTRLQLCKKLQISEGTCHNWNKAGVLKPHKIGGRVMYRLDEVEEILNK